MALLNHQSYHQFFWHPKKECPCTVFKFLKFVYQGFRMLSICRRLVVEMLSLLVYYFIIITSILIVYIYLLYLRSSCGHPFGIPDFYGFLGLATNMTSHARSVRAGGTNILRQGNKLDRTVLLPEPWRKSTEAIEELCLFAYQSIMASQPY